MSKLSASLCMELARCVVVAWVRQQLAVRLLSWRTEMFMHSTCFPSQSEAAIGLGSLPLSTSFPFVLNVLYFSYLTWGSNSLCQRNYYCVC